MNGGTPGELLRLNNGHPGRTNRLLTKIIIKQNIQHNFQHKNKQNQNNSVKDY